MLKPTSGCPFRHPLAGQILHATRISIKLQSNLIESRLNRMGVCTHRKRFNAFPLPQHSFRSAELKNSC